MRSFGVSGDGITPVLHNDEPVPIRYPAPTGNKEADRAATAAVRVVLEERERYRPKRNAAVTDPRTGQTRLDALRLHHPIARKRARCDDI